jgi:antagonist of KipI
MIRVLKPGWSAVQDSGREGHQRFGVVVGGAADPFALHVANALLGNHPQAAGLEFTLTGPRLEFENDALVAWCGADFEASLGDKALPKNRPVRVPAGGVLDFSAARQGTTAWLAVAGGIIVPAVMGSRSTDLVARLGGVEGRRLGTRDRLPVGVASAWASAMYQHLRTSPAGWCLPPERLGDLAKPGLFRTVRGPEWDWFAADAQAGFFRDAYHVTRDSNRMGVRLTGPALKLVAPRELISAAVNHGVVQIPSSGQPILLGADRQTIGGYPRVGVVAAVDFGRLAQLRPGDGVTFHEVTVAEAQALLLQRERDLARALGELGRRIGLR